MAAAALPLMLASSAFSAFGQIASGNAQAQAYDYNARVERQQAGVALDQATVRARQVEDKVARTAGEAKAQYGAAGVVPTTGSALMVLNDIATQGEMSRQLELYQGRLTASGHLQQADVDRAQGSVARTAGYIGAASTLLGSIAQGAGKAFTPSAGASRIPLVVPGG